MYLVRVTGFGLVMEIHATHHHCQTDRVIISLLYLELKPLKKSANRFSCIDAKMVLPDMLR